MNAAYMFFECTLMLDGPYSTHRAHRSLSASFVFNGHRVSVQKGIHNIALMIAYAVGWWLLRRNIVAQLKQSIPVDLLRTKPFRRRSHSR